MKSIHLQGIGDVPAVPASALEPGMVRQYNYGATATILSVFRVSEKTLSLVEKSTDSGNIHSYRIRAATLVSICMSTKKETPGLRINPMCNDCALLGRGCEGTFSTVWTGCVYHITKAEEIAAAKNREVPNV